MILIFDAMILIFDLDQKICDVLQLWLGHTTTAREKRPLRTRQTVVSVVNSEGIDKIIRMTVVVDIYGGHLALPVASLVRRETHKYFLALRAME